MKKIIGCRPKGSQHFKCKHATSAHAMQPRMVLHPELLGSLIHVLRVVSLKVGGLYRHVARKLVRHRTVKLKVPSKNPWVSSHSLTNHPKFTLKKQKRNEILDSHVALSTDFLSFAPKMRSCTRLWREGMKAGTPRLFHRASPKLLSTREQEECSNWCLRKHVSNPSCDLASQKAPTFVTRLAGLFFWTPNRLTSG